MSITLGADPEFPLLDSKGTPVPAHSVGIRGKEEKHEVPHVDYGENGPSKFFRDGFSLEINPSPATCRAFLVMNTAQTIQAAFNELALKSKGLTIGYQATVKVDPRTLKGAPKDVLETGCDPSWDAYKLESKYPKLNLRHHPFRYFGAHIHYTHPTDTDGSTGRSLLDPATYPEKVRVLDAYLGLPMTYLFASSEMFMRRQYYGSAGEFRPQRHPTGRFEQERDSKGKLVFHTETVESGWTRAVPVWNYEKPIHAVGLEYRVLGPEMWRNQYIANFALGVGREALKMHERGEIKAPSPEHFVALQAAINNGEAIWETLEQLQPGIPDYYDLPTLKWLKERWEHLPGTLLTYTGDPHNDGFEEWLEIEELKEAA